MDIDVDGVSVSDFYSFLGWFYEHQGNRWRASDGTEVKFFYVPTHNPPEIHVEIVEPPQVGDPKVEIWKGTIIKIWPWGDKKTRLSLNYNALPQFVEFSHMLAERAMAEFGTRSEERNNEAGLVGNDEPGDCTPNGTKISNLSPRDRRIYDMWKSGNYIKKDVARELGINVSTVGNVSRSIGISW